MKRNSFDAPCHCIAVSRSVTCCGIRLFAPSLLGIPFPYGCLCMGLLSLNWKWFICCWHGHCVVHAAIVVLEPGTALTVCCLQGMCGLLSSGKCAWHLAYWNSDKSRVFHASRIADSSEIAEVLPHKYSLMTFSNDVVSACELQVLRALTEIAKSVLHVNCLFWKPWFFLWPLEIHINEILLCWTTRLSTKEMTNTKAHCVTGLHTRKNNQNVSYMCTALNNNRFYF